MPSAIEPPGPRSRLPGSTLLRFRHDRLGFLLATARTYGDFASFTFAGQPVYLVSDPEAIQTILETENASFVKGRALERSRRLLGNGLLTSEGDFHRRQRRLVMPAFHGQRMAGYGATMVDLALAHADRWQDGAAVDVATEMMHLTRAIVAKTLFDLDIAPGSGSGSGSAAASRPLSKTGSPPISGSMSPPGLPLAAASTSVARSTLAAGSPPVPGSAPGPLPSADIIDNAMATLVGSFGSLALFLPPWIVESGLWPSAGRIARSRTVLDDMIYAMIAERKASGRDHGDLLSMLLAAVDDEGDGRGMTDRQVRDEVMTLFLAGHETTANALAWTWFLLSEHPEAEQRLHAELDRVLAGRAPTVDDLPALRYTRAVFTESMRLYPPAWLLGRRAVRDCVVGGYGIPRGATLLMSQWVVHHDPRHYRDPFRFDPERWLSEAGSGSTPGARSGSRSGSVSGSGPAAPPRPKYAYFPFGGGPRRCIGEAFGWTEGLLIIAALAQRWHLRLVPGHPVVPDPLITLRPKHGIRATLTVRGGGRQAAVA